MLSEEITAGTWLAILCGLIGVFVILRPGGSILQAKALLPLAAALCLSVYMLLLKMLAKTETASSLIFYVPIAGMLVSGAALSWVGTIPNVSDLGLLAIMGVLGGVALFLRNEAYSSAPASVIAPFEYTGVIWAAIFGFFVFGDPVTTNLALGSGILITTNFYVFWRRSARSV